MVVRREGVVEASQSVPDLLARRARANPSGRAVGASRAGYLTFGEWADRSALVRDALVQRGVGPGDVVALTFSSQSWLEFVVSYVGVLRAGGCCALHEPYVEGNALQRRTSRPTIELVGTTEQDVRPEALVLPDLLASGAPAVSDVPATRDTPLDIVFTSGTTRAEPKAVRFRHGDWLLPQFPTPEHRQLRILHGGIPPHASAGVHGLMLTHLMQGKLSFASSPQALGQRELMVTRRSIARQYLQDIREVEPHEVVLTPLLAADVAELEPSTERLNCVKYIKFNGGPLRPDVGLALQRLMPNARILSLYGLTEAGPGMVVGLWDPVTPKALGRPVGTTQVRVLTPEHRACAPGETGEVGLRSTAPTAPTAATDGWVRTGDVGYLDEHGVLHLVGRASQFIALASGQKISVAGLEDRIMATGIAADVCALGIPAEGSVSDLIAVALVPCDPSLAPDQAWDALAELPADRRPTRLALVPSLPYSATGKIRRAEVASMFSERTVPTERPEQ